MPRPLTTDPDHALEQVHRDYRDALPCTTPQGNRIHAYRVLSTFRKALPSSVEKVLLVSITGQVAEFPRSVLNLLKQLDNSMGYARLSDPAAIWVLQCSIVVAVLARRPHSLFQWH